MNANIGLAGLGRVDDWQVDIDHLIDLDLYGITIANHQFSLQVFEVPIDRINALQHFLRESKQAESLDFRSAFGGKLEFVNHNGFVHIRIRHEGEYGPNLVTIVVDHEGCAKLCTALNAAITEAELPE